MAEGLAKRRRTAQLVERLTMVKPASIMYFVLVRKVERVPRVYYTVNTMFLLRHKGVVEESTRLLTLNPYHPKQFYKTRVTIGVPPVGQDKF